MLKGIPLKNHEPEAAENDLEKDTQAHKKSSTSFNLWKQFESMVWEVVQTLGIYY